MKNETITITWSVDDILSRDTPRQGRRPLTREEAAEILQDLKRRHDATIGINWDVIDVFVDSFDRSER